MIISLFSYVILERNLSSFLMKYVVQFFEINKFYKWVWLALNDDNTNPNWMYSKVLLKYNDFSALLNVIVLVHLISSVIERVDDAFNTGSANQENHILCALHLLSFWRDLICPPQTDSIMNVINAHPSS